MEDLDSALGSVYRDRVRVQPNCKMEGLGRELVRVPRYCKHEVHDNRSIPDLAYRTPTATRALIVRSSLAELTIAVKP